MLIASRFTSMARASGKRLEYVEATGGAWIDSGVNYASDVGVECDCAFDAASPEDTGPFDGARVVGDYDVSFLLIKTGSGMMRFDRRGRSTYSFPFTANRRMFKFDADTGFVTDGIYGDIGWDDQYYADPYSSEHTIPVFGMQWVDSYEPARFFHGRIYSIRFFKSGALAFDGVGWIKGGEVGMMDLVTGRFLRNQGAGAFVAGPQMRAQASATGGGGVV
ncbi:MAG: hypothetical protein ACI4RA_03540 [Kiritimatiellia bacterium]